MIANRYLRHHAGLTREAVSRLEEDLADPGQLAETEEEEEEEEMAERPLNLNEQRPAAGSDAIGLIGSERGAAPHRTTIEPRTRQFGLPA